jgi:hypothetical protein
MTEEEKHDVLNSLELSLAILQDTFRSSIDYIDNEFTEELTKILNKFEEELKVTKND